MAIALDTAGGTISAGVGTNPTWSFNNVAGSFLVVGFAVNKNTDVVTGVTYNGVAMSLALSFASPTSNNEYSYLYYLVNPATGTNTISITVSTSSTVHAGFASYTGVDLTSPIDGTDTASLTEGAGSTIVETIVSTANNCWMCAFSGLQRASTASTNSTERGGVSGGGKYYDSNGAITPAGSFSMTQNIASNGPATGVAFTFKPATSAIKTVGGLAKASVKTVGGLAIASVKTIGGLA